MVGPACLVEQLRGAGRIVRPRGQRVIAGGGVEIEVAGGGSIEPHHEAVADAFGVDGVVERLAHARILEPGALFVPADPVVVGVEELDAVKLAAQARRFQVAHPLFGLELKIEPELPLLEELEADGRVEHDAVDDPVQPGLAPPVAIVAHERDVIAALPFLEPERPGPYRLAVQPAVQDVAGALEQVRRIDGKGG